MRALIVIAYACAIFAVIALTHKDKGGPDIDPASIAIALCYYPILIISCMLFMYSLVQLRRGKARVTAVMICLLSLPMPAVAIRDATSQMNRSKSTRWPNQALTIGDHLLDYLEKNPDAFRYIGNDEEVTVMGFGDYLEFGANASSVNGEVRIKKGVPVDPWGQPVRFGLDRNHDGYIEIEGNRIRTHSATPPNLDYEVAVVVFLSHLDNGDIRPLVRRR